jgi:hypothetical protein
MFTKETKIFTFVLHLIYSHLLIVLYVHVLSFLPFVGEAHLSNI